MSTATRIRKGARGLLGRLVDASVLGRFVVGLGAVVLALLIGSAVLLAIGADPMLFVASLLYGAIGTEAQIAFTLRKATMLILAGTAIALAFRANIFNIGVQGQMAVGAFTSTMAILLAAPYLPGGSVGGIVLVLLGLVAGILGGAAYALIPGLMLAYADANEVVTTIMLNFIATGALFVLVDGPLKDPTAPAPKTPNLPAYVGFPSTLTGSSSFSIIGLGIALLAAVIVYVVMSNTVYGFDLRTTGKQAAASAFSGVDPERTIVSTMTFSGMIAGLTGAVYVLMVVGYFEDPGVFPTFGFDGIAVSLVAANNPLGVVPAGLLFGGLASASQFIDIATDVPKELVDGIIGLIVLFVAAPELFRMIGRRFDIRGGDEE